MEQTHYKLKIILQTPVLGSQSTKNITSEFIAAKAGVELDEDEVRSLPDELERGTTVFHRNAKGQPMVMDYQFKGFLKNAGSVLNGKCGMPKNLRSKVVNLVFVYPRFIMIHPPGSTNGDGFHSVDEYCERPIRAETARGDRVALARSEELPENSWFNCSLSVWPGEITEEVLRNLLDYGWDCGIGQWRTGGYGKFRYELTRED